MLNGGDANMCIKSGLNTQSLKMTQIRDPSMEGGCMFMYVNTVKHIHNKKVGKNSFTQGFSLW